MCTDGCTEMLTGGEMIEALAPRLLPSPMYVTLS